MKYNSSKLVFIIALFIIFYSCEDDNIEESTDRGTETLLEITPISGVKVIALQQVEFKIANLAGNISDYKLYFDQMLVPISDLGEGAIKIIVPIESSLGIKEVKLLYQEKEYNLGQIEIVEPLEIFPAGLNFIETGNEEMPFIFIDSLNNFHIPQFKGDKVEMLTIEKPDGTATKIHFNENQLPKYIYDEKVTIIVDSYDSENYTANFAFFPNDNIENIQYVYNFQMDEGIFSKEYLDKTTVNKSFPGIPIMYSSAFNVTVTMSTKCFGAVISDFIPNTYSVADCMGWNKTKDDYVALYDVDEDYRNAFTNRKLLDRGCLNSNDINNALGMNSARQNCTQQRLENARINIEAMNEYINSRKDYFEQISTTMNSNGNGNNVLIGLWEFKLSSSSNCDDPDDNYTETWDCENTGLCAFVEFLSSGNFTTYTYVDGIKDFENNTGDTFEIIDDNTIKLCYYDDDSGVLDYCETMTYEINNDKLIITFINSEFGCTEYVELIKK